MRSRAGRLGLVADWELIDGWGTCGRDSTERTPLKTRRSHPTSVNTIRKRASSRNLGLLDVAEHGEDFTGTQQAELLARDKLQGGRILLQPTRFAPERSILPLQFGDFLRRLNEILAGLDGLEKAAFAEDRIKKERASQEHNRQPDLSRTPALPL